MEQSEDIFSGRADNLGQVTDIFVKNELNGAHIVMIVCSLKPKWSKQEPGPSGADTQLLCTPEQEPLSDIYSRQAPSQADTKLLCSDVGTTVRYIQSFGTISCRSKVPVQAYVGTTVKHVKWYTLFLSSHFNYLVLCCIQISENYYYFTGQAGLQLLI